MNCVHFNNNFHFVEWNHKEIPQQQTSEWGINSDSIPRKNPNNWTIQLLCMPNKISEPKHFCWMKLQGNFLATHFPESNSDWRLETTQRAYYNCYVNKPCAFFKQGTIWIPAASMVSVCCTCCSLMSMCGKLLATDLSLVATCTLTPEMTYIRTAYHMQKPLGKHYNASHHEYHLNSRSWCSPAWTYCPAKLGCIYSLHNTLHLYNTESISPLDIRSHLRTSSFCYSQRVSLHHDFVSSHSCNSIEACLSLTCL